MIRPAALMPVTDRRFPGATSIGTNLLLRKKPWKSAAGVAGAAAFAGQASNNIIKVPQNRRIGSPLTRQSHSRGTAVCLVAPPFQAGRMTHLLTIYEADDLPPILMS